MLANFVGPDGNKAGFASARHVRTSEIFLAESEDIGPEPQEVGVFPRLPLPKSAGAL
jgi:hypothetical protein